MSKRLSIGLLSGALALTLALPGAVAAQDSGKDACKKGGWKDLVDASGEDFASQGDCVRYIGQAGGSGSGGGFLIAIAYSDLNGKQGFQPGSADVMIAKLIDVDGNGLDPGDKVVMGRYPTDLGATSFTRWDVDQHTVEGKSFVSSDTVEVFVAGGTGWCEVVWDTGLNFERYIEYTCATSGPGGYLSLFDATDQTDFITITPPTASEKDTTLLVQGASPSSSDDAFIDVEIYID